MAINTQETLEIGDNYYASGDYKNAFNSYTDAATKGNGDAAYKLGQMYEKGIYVKRDFKAAMQWYVIAAGKGHEKAKKRMKIIQDNPQPKDDEPKPTTLKKKKDKIINANVTVEKTNTEYNLYIENPDNKKKNLLLYILPIVAFLAGVVIPSPFFMGGKDKPKTEEIEISDIGDTINMPFLDGMYSGGIVKSTCAKNGYGWYESKSGAVYEGKWKDDRLEYGIKTSQASVYTGNFDEELNLDGFGIIEYTDEYINGKRSQGLADSEIITKYIGNWSNNYKHGIGRAIKKDGSMEFGVYKGGHYQKVAGQNYATGESVYGIDVSHFQEDIDWNNLALYCDDKGKVFYDSTENYDYMQPVLFVYIKATEGTAIKDEMYSMRSIEAEKHGIVKGAYHFLHLGSSIDAQIKNFFETATYTTGDLPPALDVELENEIAKYGVDTLRSMTLKWLREVEKKFGVCPVIYTREKIRNKYLNTADFEKYKFWIARYLREPESGDWQFWQMTEKGRVECYDGKIDIDVFKGSLDVFDGYLNN
ncbi:MAG: hypothetical protein K5685_12340 [Bacteroidales bacterium]|nr:hypothetical protein [Bacteroidales bacterium]